MLKNPEACVLPVIAGFYRIQCTYMRQCFFLKSQMAQVVSFQRVRSQNYSNKPTQVSRCSQQRSIFRELPVVRLRKTRERLIGNSASLRIGDGLNANEMAE